MRCVAVIPARYGSSRLPGKPLVDILGKPMVQHVYERVCQVTGLDEVIVATDDDRIVEAVKAFGGRAIKTSADHPSGTDRLVEVMGKVPADLYLNVQGDEPLVNPAHLATLVDAMRNSPATQVATLCHPIPSSEADNPNVVKVVRNRLGDALYFSRAKVPFVREGGRETQYFKHVGVYAYSAQALASFPSLPSSELENAELLEQLRLMDAGIAIRVLEIDHAAPGVDTPACLDRVRAILSGQPAATTPAESLADIRMVITDIDGVLTDGSIWYDETGECLKRFHVRDGLGIKMLQEAGVVVSVVSGRDSATLRKRLSDLGIADYLLGVKDKAQACQTLMARHDIPAPATAFVGDDSIDLPGFQACGWPVAVADAADYVKKHVRLVLTKPGGHGAFREFADQILAARGQSAIFDSSAGFSGVMNKMAQ